MRLTQPPQLAPIIRSPLAAQSKLQHSPLPSSLGAKNQHAGVQSRAKAIHKKNKKLLAAYHAPLPKSWLANAPKVKHTAGAAPAHVAGGTGPSSSPTLKIASGAEQGLHIAAAKGQIAVLQMLIRGGADVNVKDMFGTTPLLQAVHAGQDGCADLLIAAGARLEMRKPGEAMCSAASTPGSAMLVKRLLRAGIPPDSADYDSRTGLHLAAAEGHLDTVGALVDGGATLGFVDRWGVDALTEAVKNDQAAVVDLLLERGADPNSRDHRGHTVLLYAVFNSADCITPLVANGAKIGKDNEIAEMMCRAASTDDADMLDKLLRAGAPPDACDYDRRTALHLSAAEGKMRSVSLLVKAGATVSFKDRWGHTAVDEARGNKHHDVLKFLTGAL